MVLLLKTVMMLCYLAAVTSPLPTILLHGPPDSFLYKKQDLGDRACGFTLKKSTTSAYVFTAIKMVINIYIELGIMRCVLPRDASMYSGTETHKWSVHPPSS